MNKIKSLIKYSFVATSLALVLALALVLCLAPAPAALAQSGFKPLSDDEYRLYVENFPQYAAAEERLQRAWKILKASAPKDTQDAYLKDQRNWIKNGRHLRAGQLYRQSFSRVEAFTIATDERSAYLEDAVARETGSRPNMPIKPVAPEPAWTPEPARAPEPARTPEPAWTPEPARDQEPVRAPDPMPVPMPDPKPEPKQPPKIKILKNVKK